MSSMGTGINILGLSLGFWLMKREVQYSIAIQMTAMISVTGLVVGMLVKKSRYV